MRVSVAQYLDLVEVPTVSDEDKEVTKHPARVVSIRRGIGEAYKAVFRINIIEKSGLVARK
jgi:hypothetical protein